MGRWASPRFDRLPRRRRQARSTDPGAPRRGVRSTLPGPSRGDGGGTGLPSGPGCRLLVGSSASGRLRIGANGVSVSEVTSPAADPPGERRRISTMREHGARCGVLERPVRPARATARHRRGHSRIGPGPPCARSRLAAPLPAARARPARSGQTGAVDPLPQRSPGAIDAALHGAARGDAEAFAELYDLCSSNVYGLIRRILRDAAQSDEVLQEVMLEVWRLAPRFDATLGSASAWIMTIAHRRAVDRVRSEVAERGRVERAEQPSRRRRRAGRRGRHRRARPPAGPRRPRPPDRPAALVHRARLLRRAHPDRDRRVPRRAPRYREDAHPRRPHPPPR